MVRMVFNELLAHKNPHSEENPRTAKHFKRFGNTVSIFPAANSVAASFVHKLESRVKVGERLTAKS